MSGCNQLGYYGMSSLQGLQKCCRQILAETAHGSRHGKCREISGEILLFLFSLETKLESAKNLSRIISHHFSPDALQLCMPDFMAFFTLQTFVLDFSVCNQVSNGILTKENLVGAKTAPTAISMTFAP